MQFKSTRPHIIKLQRYQALRAKVIKGFDRVLNILTIIALTIAGYIVLVGIGVTI